MGESFMRYILPLFILLILPPTAQADWKAEFEKEFLTRPWAGAQAQENVCIECHSSDMMKPELRDIPRQWEKSWHYQNGISCHNCHGGDPKDAENAMSPQRGYVGTPKPAQIPEFCGKCHAGILKNFLESGHGKALKSSGKGPNCVTCHGSHTVQKASIQIISEPLCTKCHSYGRVKEMRQALLVTENRMNEIEKSLKELKGEGVFTEEEDKSLFSTQAEFRILFHTEDVSLVKKRTDEFIRKLTPLQAKIQKTFEEIKFRKNFSAFLMMIFVGLAIGFLLLSKSPKE
jgi:nitrate/TMAO reductase-like tetraheme cytochrome c subunit